MVGCYTRVIENAGSDKAAFEFVLRKPDIRTLNAFSCRMFSKNAPVEVGDEDGYLMRGYCPKQDTLQVLPESSETNAKIDFNKTFLNYLEKLIDKLQHDSVKIICVSHPQPKTAANEIYHQQFLNFVEPVLRKSGIPYLDYNSNHTLTNYEHFADANHLNQAGVTIWNDVLIKDLQNRGYISKP
jgi:hypothetical protein